MEFEPNEEKTVCNYVPSPKDDEDYDIDGHGAFKMLILKFFESIFEADAAEKISAIYMGLTMTLSLT